MCGSRFFLSELQWFFFHPNDERLGVDVSDETPEELRRRRRGIYAEIGEQLVLGILGVLVFVVVPVAGAWETWVVFQTEGVTEGGIMGVVTLLLSSPICLVCAQWFAADARKRIAYERKKLGWNAERIEEATAREVNARRDGALSQAVDVEGGALEEAEQAGGLGHAEPE